MASAPTARPPFHLAFPVDDLAAARGFYGELLGCREGRASATWVDFDFFGHQITAHLSEAVGPVRRESRRRRRRPGPALRRRLELGGLGGPGPPPA